MKKSPKPQKRLQIGHLMCPWYHIAVSIMNHTDTESVVSALFAPIRKPTHRDTKRNFDEFLCVVQMFGIFNFQSLTNRCAAEHLSHLQVALNRFHVSAWLRFESSERLKELASCITHESSFNDTALAVCFDNSSFPWKQSHTAKSLSQIPAQKDTDKKIIDILMKSQYVLSLFRLKLGSIHSIRNKSAVQRKKNGRTAMTSKSCEFNRILAEGKKSSKNRERV